MTEEIEIQSPVTSTLEKGSNEMDNLYELMGARAEEAGKSQDYVAQTLAHVANPKKPRSKDLHTCYQLT